MGRFGLQLVDIGLLIAFSFIFVVLTLFSYSLTLLSLNYSSHWYLIKRPSFSAFLLSNSFSTSTLNYFTFNGGASFI